MFPTDPLAAVCAVLVSAAIVAAALRYYREEEIVARYHVRAEAVAEAARQAAAAIAETGKVDVGEKTDRNSERPAA